MRTPKSMGRRSTNTAEKEAASLFSLHRGFFFSCHHELFPSPQENNTVSTTLTRALSSGGFQHVNKSQHKARNDSVDPVMPRGHFLTLASLQRQTLLAVLGQTGKAEATWIHLQMTSFHLRETELKRQ